MSITAKKKERGVVFAEERSHTEHDGEISSVRNRAGEEGREIGAQSYQMQTMASINMFYQPFVMNGYQPFTYFVPAYHSKGMYYQE